MATLTPTRIAILCACVAAISFTLNDTAIKFLSGDYPLHQVVFFRSVAGLVFILAIFIPLDGGFAALKTKRLGMHLVRGLCVVTANMMYFTGLATLTMGESSAIFYVSPLLITAFSVWFLHEKVGPRRWLAVVVGLGGVLVVLQPGTGAFRLAGLLPLAAATSYALLHVMTRKIGVTERASTMALYIQLTFVVVSSSIGLGFGDGRYSGGHHPSVEFLLRAWIWPDAGDLLIMIAIGGLSSIGGYCISQAYRLSEANIIAPFEYLALPFAIFWGWLLFAETLGGNVWLGIALIVGSGLFIVWRESRLDAEPSRQRPVRR